MYVHTKTGKYNPVHTHFFQYNFIIYKSLVYMHIDVFESGYIHKLIFVCGRRGLVTPALQV